MIKQMKVDGRDATVAFFDDRMNPASEENATGAEILFDEGFTASDHELPGTQPGAKPGQGDKGERKPAAKTSTKKTSAKKK